MPVYISTTNTRAQPELFPLEEALAQVSQLVHACVCRVCVRVRVHAVAVNSGSRSCNDWLVGWLVGWLCVCVCVYVCVAPHT
jgi:hypothetical protein